MSETSIFFFTNSCLRIDFLLVPLLENVGDDNEGVEIMILKFLKWSYLFNPLSASVALI